ncbi:MAG: LL-diaminopimelate aminotransferase [Erysipelotrichaceae bacterium]|nr:LL-diaminopimelate aminotransferase [Erysipelotrichaceae bacterium]
MINKNLDKLDKDNTFSLVNKKLKAFKIANPNKKVVSLGIGDVSKPICKPVIDAMHKAVDELADMKTFSGYGNYYGIEKLRDVIIKNDYKDFGFSIDEVYVSDGTKTDSTSILELFDKDAKILLGNPLYPIYKNGCLALNKNIEELPLNKDYKLSVPNKHFDIIYLCSPNNPIGNAYTYDELTRWIKYALKNKSVILFDNVYEPFISSKDVPHSIYEIKGAKKCAIEFRSFSKKASFTGLRCSYFIIPKQLDKNVNYYWKERTLNRFNGASYVAQAGAIATYSKQAKKIQKQNINEYKKNARFLKKSFIELGFEVIGGDDAPFMWLKIKEKSWKFFDFCLNKLNVVVIPGVIFGANGEYHVRISALGKLEDSKIAIERFKKYYEK